MKKNITTIIILVIIVLGGYFLFIDGGDKTENLTLDSELNPIELTDDEKAALEDENLEIGNDSELTENLAKVRSSDEIESIEQDINDTNFQDLDKELAELEKLLGGL